MSRVGLWVCPSHLRSCHCETRLSGCWGRDGRDEGTLPRLAKLETPSEGQRRSSVVEASARMLFFVPVSLHALIGTAYIPSSRSCFYPDMHIREAGKLRDFSRKLLCDETNLAYHPENNSIRRTQP